MSSNCAPRPVADVSTIVLACMLFYHTCRTLSDLFARLHTFYRRVRPVPPPRDSTTTTLRPGGVPRSQCCVCKTSQVNAMTTPCCHVACCGDCAEMCHATTGRCCICNIESTGFMPFFWSAVILSDTGETAETLPLQ